MGGSEEKQEGMNARHYITAKHSNPTKGSPCSPRAFVSHELVSSVLIFRIDRMNRQVCTANVRVSRCAVTSNPKRIGELLMFVQNSPSISPRARNVSDDTWRHLRNLRKIWEAFGKRIRIQISAVIDFLCLCLTILVFFRPIEPLNIHLQVIA